MTEVNGNGMKMGEFKGKVLTHLEYLKEAQDKQSEELKSIKDGLGAHLIKSGKAIAVLNKMMIIGGTWLSYLTMKIWR